MNRRNSNSIAIAAAAAILLLSGLAVQSQAGDFQDIMDTPAAGSGKQPLTTVYKPLAKKRTLDRSVVEIAPSIHDVSESGGSFVGKAAPQTPRPRVRTITRDMACSENPFIGTIGTLLGICDNG
jgi:hypothetical protein